MVMLVTCLPLVVLGFQVLNLAGSMVREETRENLKLAAQLESNRIDSQMSRAIEVLLDTADDPQMVALIDALDGPSRGQVPAEIAGRLDTMRDQLAVEGLKGVVLQTTATARYEPVRWPNKISDQTVSTAAAIGPTEPVRVSDAFFTPDREVRVAIVVQVQVSQVRYVVATEWDLQTLLGFDPNVSTFGPGTTTKLTASTGDDEYLVLMATDAATVGRPTSFDLSPTPGNAVVAEASLPSGKTAVRAAAKTGNEHIDWVVVVDGDPDQLFARLQAIQNNIIVLFLVAGIVIVTVMTAMLRGIVRRIRQMTELAEAVADGDLSVRTGDVRHDELGRLSQAFDDMAEALAQDIARRERVEAQLAHQATHDPLTGLPNRQQLVGELDRLLTESADAVSVLFVDLDGFKAVNDRLGHAAGDELLVRVGDRLRSVLRPGDYLARLGGDEFLIVLCGLGLLDAERMGERIVSALELPFIVADDEVHISASIGVSSATDQRSTERLIKEADIAMYRAKALGKGRAVRVTHETLTANMEQLSILRELREATSKGQIELLLCPVGDLRSGALRGFSTSLQWRHPERGVVNETELMAMASATGSAASIDEWLITEAAAQFARWATIGLPVQDLELGINLTPEVFLSSRTRHLLTDELTRHRLRASSLRVEVPESVLTSDSDVLRQVFDGFRALGTPVTLDRFGSDYTSLDRLPQFGIDAVKIDLNLISELSNRQSSRALVSSLIILAKTAGLRVAAAGVDNDQLRKEMVELGCLLGQGRWISQAVTPQEADDLLRSRFFIDAG